MLLTYGVAGLIGAATGAVELLGRYRDDPWSTLRAKAAIFYIFVNAAASVLAYDLVLVFDVRFGLAAGPSDKLTTIQVLLAGLSAMAFFRTALFTVRVGDADVSVGPGLILQVLLAVTDRSIDRGRAMPRASDVPVIMDGVDFAKAAEALPAFCFGVMQNIDSEEQTAARKQIAIISGASLSSGLKCSLLGLLLVNLVGRPVLKSAVTALGTEIR